MLDHGGAANLADESAPKRTPNGSARVVGSETEQKRGSGLRPLQKRGQLRHSFASAAVGIHVDFQRNETHVGGQP